ncbi:hypothetical protein M422DRAFT_784624 [Sphaerobolus stellatus SS14]|uniref:Enoyl reductase (ER) domain-containing protein n=1 Tax=Sphaerobolus stellatus (strain SS14) TaxID=990650 RepID=A0A0C9USG7_SPHS4|nr:hypothetical protein M422DRAFT_784624 [Sphaerobolus stellatus SS14]
MVKVSNPRVIMNKHITDGYPIPGETVVYDTTEEIDLDNAPLDGGVLSRSSQYRPIPEGFGNFGVGVVLRSENPKYKTGDHVYGIIAFQAYVIHKDVPPLTVLPHIENLPLSVYTGTLGMAGQTAYIGWKLYSEAKKGETVFVSTAAGPVGSAVVQIAKAQGLKVVASAGSDEKIEFVKQLGADVAFNYKTQDTRAILEGLENGIDIFWDNVGGETLEIAIDTLNSFGRIISCGSISQYNVTEKYGIKNLTNVVGKRLSIKGFIVSVHFRLLGDFYAEVPQKVASGEFKYAEHRYEGLDQTGQAILDVQKGNNKAKAVIVVANE